jgi:hypothetical protein
MRACDSRKGGGWWRDSQRSQRERLSPRHIVRPTAAGGQAAGLAAGKAARALGADGHDGWAGARAARGALVAPFICIVRTVITGAVVAPGLRTVVTAGIRHPPLGERPTMERHPPCTAWPLRFASAPLRYPVYKRLR